MHELSVTQNILEIANRYAESAQASRVTDLYLVIGQLSSVVDDSVQFYWDMLAEGTYCEGATLHFSRLPAIMRCLDCERDYSLDSGLRACPVCGGSRVALVQGDEFKLESIEIEKREDIATIANS